MHRMATKSNDGKELLNWTRPMDDALVDAFMYEYKHNNKVNGTCSTIAYENIVEVLSTKFAKKVDKYKIKNHWKILKKLVHKHIIGFPKKGKKGIKLKIELQ